MTQAIALEMGLTHAEFFRTLPSALADINYRVEGRQVLIDYANGSVVISLEAQQQRRIALLSMPYTPVRFVFEDLDQNQADAFMDHFMRYYQRGGG